MSKNITSDKKIRTKSAIVDAAQEAFFKRGYHDTDMGQIAEIAGIDKRTIYRYFNSKEALAFSIWQKVLTEILSFAKTAQGETAYERLENLLYGYMSQVESNHRIIRFIGEFDHVFSGEYPHIEEAEEFVSYIATSENKILEYLQQGLEEKSIRASIDAELTARTISNILIAMSERVVIRDKHLKEEQGYSYEMLNQSVHLLLEGIKAK